MTEERVVTNCQWCNEEFEVDGTKIGVDLYCPTCAQSSSVHPVTESKKEEAKFSDEKINKKTRLVLFLITGAALFAFFNYKDLTDKNPEMLCKIAFFSSFFGIFNCLFSSSEKKAHSKKRTHYIILFTLFALCLLFVPIHQHYTWRDEPEQNYLRHQLLFSEYDSGERINLGLLYLQLILVLTVPASLLYTGTELPKIKFYRLTILNKPRLNFKKLSFAILITSICLPVFFAPHEYQHRGNTAEYYKSKTKSKTLVRGQLLILYRPLFTIPDPKASIGGSNFMRSDGFYVYHQRLRVDLLLLYWLLIVLLSGATFFATRQKRVG
jgi:hypothetical protein